MQQLKAWSFSRYQTYTQCPLKAKLQFIDKLRIAPSPAMDRGRDMHKLCETFLKTPRAKIPPELERFKLELRAIKKDKAKAEVEWAFDANYSKVDWFHYKAWLRVKTDALIIKPPLARLIDFKTGRPKEDHEEQLSLYALAAFQMDSRIQTAVTELWYLDTGDMTPFTFQRKQMADLQDEWEEKTKAMLSDTEFVANPGFLCRFCDFSINATGEHKGKCQF